MTRCMQAPDPRSDGELLVATVTDPDAFGVFYQRHVRGVLSFFRRRTSSGELAFDLTSETFAAALEAVPRYELREEPARGWLYGIAWNKLHEAQRRGQVQDAARRALGMAPVVVTDEGLDRLERLAGEPALEALEGLPADQRQAVRARVIEERSYDEIATQLQCSESVVRQRVSRGMRAMRDRLSGGLKP
jgi:RNA polymerase sigma factor (sigma-70 family)